MNLRRTTIVPALIAAAALGWIVPAHARNPHCAGGIQYVVGGLRDKEKGNLEDYKRQFSKAVQQLEQCVGEDAEDAEAMGYLGWAYAETDAAEKAGVTFAKAIEKLKTKGDTKKVDWATNNRDSYWANAFNDGIGKIGAAQAAYPDYTVKPKNDEEKKLREEAGKNYEAAIASLTKASFLRPNHAQTIRNLGSVHVFLGDFKKAGEIYTAGLAVAPNDSVLVGALKLARTNHASLLLEDKKFDEAIAFFEDLLKTDARNGELQSGMADALFQKAGKAEGDAKKPAFKAAGDGYAKAFSLRPENPDLAFNAALAYQNAGEWQPSEVQWRNVVRLKPTDIEAVSSLAAVLAEQKKYDEAQKVLLDGLAIDPKSKTLHRQLGGVYTRAGHNVKANEELMVYLALQNGQPAADAGVAAKGSAPAGAAGPKALAASGNPEQVYAWEASGEQYHSWFYWTKRMGLHFKSGIQIVVSDWSKGPSGAAVKK
ncbi:MAG: tetratricopeptide repeat protein [Candidatus Eisenbacteria bacterium]